MIKDAIIKIVNKGDLTYDEAKTVMLEIMNGQTTPTQNAAFLAALSTKSTKAETIDDFTGPDLRSPGQGAGRQSGGNGIDGRLIFPDRTVYGGTDMHDVGKAQDVEIAFDVNAAKFADASQVVSA